MCRNGVGFFFAINMGVWFTTIVAWKDERKAHTMTKAYDIVNKSGIRLCGLVEKFSTIYTDARPGSKAFAQAVADYERENGITERFSWYMDKRGNLHDIKRNFNGVSY